jgi:hypothetical protein
MKSLILLKTLGPFHLNYESIVWFSSARRVEWLRPDLRCRWSCCNGPGQPPFSSLLTSLGSTVSQDHFGKQNISRCLDFRCVRSPCRTTAWKNRQVPVCSAETKKFLGSDQILGSFELHDHFLDFLRFDWLQTAGTWIILWHAFLWSWIPLPVLQWARALYASRASFTSAFF